VYLFGLLSWVLAGLLTGCLASRLLPDKPALASWQAATVGLSSAVAGGLLATGLGFGGLASYDTRSLATATLATVVGLLIWRLRKTYP